MTREKEIRQAGIEYTLKNRPMCIGGDAFSEMVEEMNRNHAFEEGAKWADANPNLYNDEKYHTVKVSCLDELNKKAVLYDAFLEKACMWLSLNMTDVIYMGMNGTLHKPEFIQNFKQAMEE